MLAQTTRSPTTVLIVAGGSGGHIFPAVSVMQILRRARPAWRLILVMTRDPRDQRAIASEPSFMRDGHVHLELTLRLTTHPMGRLASWPRLWSFGRYLMRTWQPSAVLGFGGWLSVPVLAAAKSRGVPILIHEQNVQPGRANALLGRLAGAVAVSFEETKRLWPQVASKMVMTGNPIRFADEPATVPNACLPGRQARQQWGVADDTRTVLAMGGSGGAAVINEALPAACARLPRELLAQLLVIHLTGNHRTEAVQARYRALGIPARVIPFLDQMASAYRVADVVVARAGASTVAELAHFGCPAIFVPYPYARRHQWSNARYVERSGGAVVFEQDHRLVPRLAQTLESWLRAPQALDTMRQRIRHAAQSCAAERVAHLLLTVAEGAR